MKVTLTLVATGRRSGQPREVVLYAFADGDRWVVVGSRGGSPIDPRWAENLRANPSASIRLGSEQVPVVASEVEGAERDRLWAMVSAEYPTYAYFERKTRRRIPIFVLEPAPG